MYVVIKTITVPKDKSSEMAAKFDFGDKYHQFGGFVKEEVGVSEGRNEDTVVVIDYWQDHESFKNWHGSAEHREGHRNRPKPDYPMEVKHFTFELLDKTHR